MVLQDYPVPTSGQVDSGIVDYFSTFYQTSDSPTEHEKYAKSFTKNATLHMASKTVEGYDQILALRTGMWTAVKSRLHKVSQLIPVGTSGTEVMLYGTVHYVLKDGRQTTMPWAGRAKMEKEDGEWKMGFYQVYIDTIAVQNAK